MSVAALALLLGAPAFRPGSPLSPGLAAVAAVPILAALLLLDLAAWARARRVSALAAALEPALGVAQGRLLDFGVGDGACGLPSPASYRSPESVRPAFQGDPGLARRLLARAATLSTLALAVAAGAAVIALSRA